MTFYGQVHYNRLTYTLPLPTHFIIGRAIMILPDIPRDSWHIFHCRRMDPGCMVSLHSALKGDLLAWVLISSAHNPTCSSHTGMVSKRAVVFMSNLEIQRL